LPNPGILRSEIRRLFNWLKEKGLTTVILLFECRRNSWTALTSSPFAFSNVPKECRNMLPGLPMRSAAVLLHGGNPNTPLERSVKTASQS
jgi:hypothetical protein